MTDTQPILDAACLVVADDSGTEARLLLGRRHADQIFLPNKWVFPGGRVDDGDRALAAAIAQTSPPQLQTALGPFAVAAVRELFEETGLVLGTASGCDVFNGLTAWRGFTATGFAPAIHGLTPLARAITPPGRPRRYDTWFFTALRSAIAAEYAENDGELLDLGWFTFSQARRLDLPNITRLILDDVAHGPDRAVGAQHGWVPFYFQANSGYQRTLIDPDCDLACGGPEP